MPRPHRCDAMVLVACGDKRVAGAAALCVLEPAGGVVVPCGADFAALLGPGAYGTTHFALRAAFRQGAVEMRLEAR